MLENNRDEINYHKFLKSVRKAQGVSLEKTAFGVCTKSGMSRIEAGSRLPDKLVRDRLTARLGISGEEYEEYLLPREYEQWELRMDILRCINKKDISGTEENLAKYEAKYNVNSVEKQFIEAMRFMLFEMKGLSDDVLCTQIYNTMICTIPDMDIAFAGIQLLADQELNLIMEYVRLYKGKISGISLTEWKLKEYQKIVTYVEESRMDKIAQAKVYSKLACFISELILNEYETEESLLYALELCSKAIEVLRETLRLYYFVEINEYRMKLIEKLYTYSKAVDEVRVYEELKQTSKEWIKLFFELYTENNISIYMENFTHLYVETQCNNVSDVIRKRRAMMGLSRRKFAGVACDERTLMRIELEDGNPSMATVRELFDRIGICAEYKRAKVVTSNVEALTLIGYLSDRLNESKYEDAYNVYVDLCKKIDMDIPYNEQEMRRIEGLILRKTGKISMEEYKEMVIDTVECTLSMEALMSNSEKYFSEAEYFCVQDFAMYTEGKVQEYCRRYLESMCTEILEMDTVDATQFCIHECAMSKCLNYMGDDGKYKLSREISRKLLKESLRNRRMGHLVNGVYNELWCSQKLLECNCVTMNNNFETKVLNRCLLLSDLTNLSDWKNFFQQKLYR